MMQIYKLYSSRPKNNRDIVQNETINNVQNDILDEIQYYF